MAFDASGLLRLAHILFASLWFGGAVYQLTMVGGTLRQAGPAAGGFLSTLAARGGIGKYFAVTGGLTLLFGFAIYGVRMSDDAMDPYSGYGLWITFGAIVAAIAYLHGFLVNHRVERQWLAFMRGLKGPPTKEQQATMADFGMRMGKNGAASVLLIATAMLLMLLSRVFP